MPTRQYLHPSRVDALITVLEGECDGLTVTRETAEAILHYLENAPAGVGVPAPARYPEHTSFCCGNAHNCRQREKSCAMRGDVLGREHERGAPSGVKGPEHG